MFAFIEFYKISNIDVVLHLLLLLVSGYALDTRFEIKCRQWLDPGNEESLGEGLLYRFWSIPRGGSEAQLLYYGTDPYTPKVQFPLGHLEYDYVFDVRIQIANPIGESADAWIHLQVRERERENILFICLFVCLFVCLFIYLFQLYFYFIFLFFAGWEREVLSGKLI